MTVHLLIFRGGCEILDILALHQAYRRTRASMQKKAGVFDLQSKFEDILGSIARQSFQPGRYHCFVVRDPKLREIFAPCFRDRLVHHLIIDRIAPLLDKTFIHDAHSNRPGVGTHTAIKRLQLFLRQAPKQSAWLHGDIKSYFTSIDKNILFEILKERLGKLKGLTNAEKAQLLSLSFRVVFQNPAAGPRLTGNQHLLKHIPPHKSLFTRPPHIGLPIGSLTSQFFSNLYLDELDQFCKHELRIKRYVRYVDDFMIVGYPPKELSRFAQEIRQFLQERLRLDLHPNKLVIQPVTHGADFLGYVVFPHFVSVRKRTIRALRRRLYLLNHVLDPAKFPIRSIPGASPLRKLAYDGLLTYGLPTTFYFVNHALQVVNSYYGIFSHANTYTLRRKIYERDFFHLKDFFIPTGGFKSFQLRGLKKLREEGRIEIAPSFLGNTRATRI